MLTGNTLALRLENLAPGIRLLTLSGELDLFAAPELKQAISRALDADTRDLIVDLTHTAFIDSSGLAALILAMKRARSRGGQMVVVDADGAVSRTFRMAGLDQIVTIVTSREAALAELSTCAGG
ncbi:MAG: anti-sigma factor antagonist [Solirubrobacteraceae bacterium]|nr:anti-sigma factor antagonist [Solirubrobacteraceae bacterium]